MTHVHCSLFLLQQWTGTGRSWGSRCLDTFTWTWTWNWPPESCWSHDHVRGLRWTSQSGQDVPLGSGGTTVTGPVLPWDVLDRRPRASVQMFPLTGNRRLSSAGGEGCPEGWCGDVVLLVGTLTLVFWEGCGVGALGLVLTLPVHKRPLVRTCWCL